jgi:hypothetical protein
LHPRIPQKSNATITFFEGKGAHGLPQEVSIHEGLQTFAGPTKTLQTQSQRQTNIRYKTASLISRTATPA